MEFHKILTRKNSLRKETKDLNSEVIEKAIQDLNDILLEKQEEENAVLAVQQEREAKLEEIREMMESAGLNSDDLLSTLSTPKKTRKPVSAKYRILDKDDNEHTWSGRGRTPQVIQNYLDEGGSLETLLINKDVVEA